MCRDLYGIYFGIFNVIKLLYSSRLRFVFFIYLAVVFWDFICGYRCYNIKCFRWRENKVEEGIKLVYKF